MELKASLFVVFATYFDNTGDESNLPNVAMALPGAVFLIGNCAIIPFNELRIVRIV